MLGQYGVASRGGGTGGGEGGCKAAGAKGSTQSQPPGKAEYSSREGTKGGNIGGAAAAEGKGPGKGSYAEVARWPRGDARAYVDEEGFQLVPPRGARGKAAVYGRGQEGSGVAPSANAPPPPRPKWSDAESDDEGGVDEEDHRQGDDDDHEEEEDDADEGCAAEDPTKLRDNYRELDRAVRDLEKRGGFGQDGTALRALREARDKAERLWREAKPPAPLPTRLGWAEAKLDKAAAALTKARMAIDDLDTEYERRREELYQRVGVAESWYRWRQQQLDELHDEAAQRAPSRWRAAEGGEGAEVRDKIRDQILPQIQLVMEHLDGNPEILDKLSLVAAGLVDAESRLEARSAGGRAERFNMADGDDDELATDGTTRTTAARSDLVEAQPIGGPGGPGGEGKGGKSKTAEWRSEGPGRWSRAAAAGKAGGTGVATATQGTSPTDQPGQGTGAGGGSAGDDRGPGDGDEGMEDAQPASDEEDADTSKRRQRRRRCTDEEAREEARLAADRRRAEELRQQQAAAVAAQVNSFNAGAGGFGSNAALSHAAQSFVLEVQRAQERAAAKEIEPKTKDGRSLLQLAPLELREWVTENLGDGDEL